MKDYAEYLESNLEKNHPEFLQTITTKFNTPSVSMAEAISEHFGETRITVLKNVIEMGIRQLYLSFDLDIRKELAEAADGKTTKFMLSKGAKITSTTAFGHFEDEWTDWRMQNYSSRIHERASEMLEEDSSLDGSDALMKACADLKSEFPWEDGKC
jgi:hypothetical protein